MTDVILYTYICFSFYNKIIDEFEWLMMKNAKNRYNRTVVTEQLCNFTWNECEKNIESL